MTTILICEKPDAAKKIAQALSEKKVKSKKYEGINYYEFERNKKKHVTVSAVGHLFSLKDTSKKGWVYPVSEMEWVPVFDVNRKAEFARKYYNTIKEICKNGKVFRVSTDFDEEG